MTLTADVVPAALTDAFRARARSLGFVRVGVARAEPLREEGARLRAWIEAGHHGQMQWMAETADVRADVAAEGMLPGARSVVVLVTPYARADVTRVAPPGRIARYAVGRDYHNVLDRRVRKLEKWLRERGFPARASVDTRPVFERAWAQRAGVGFVGKNCCLIVPGLGSFVFLTCVVTTAELVPDEPMRERCGDCTLCLDACPTNAFVAPRKLDARRCVSYLTIEHEGAIDEDLREGIGEWLFGCDVCQEVCPYNQGARSDADGGRAFAAAERWEGFEAQGFLGIDDARFPRFAEGSALRRAGATRLARNAAIVLGNRGDRRHLPVLDGASREDPSADVREAATWAAAKIRERG